MMKIVKPRIPYQYYTFKNCVGESSNTHHAGSYHKALRVAGIKDYNIMSYSSVVPAISEEVKEIPSDLVYGQVLEGIICENHGYRGELISSGIAVAWLYEDEEIIKKYGGLVVERKGSFSKEDLEDELYKSLMELYNDSYSEYYWNQEDTLYLTSICKPSEMYGTAIAGMIFINYAELEN